MSSASLPQGISLRPLQKRDASALAALHAACLPPGWSEAGMAETLSGASVRGEGIFAESGELLAFLLYRLLPDAYEILTLAVEPNARRNGYASLLMSRMEREAAGTPCWLEVQADNHPAQSLYASLGYVVEGRRKEYYRTAQGRVDAVMMRKTKSSAASR